MSPKSSIITAYTKDIAESVSKTLQITKVDATLYTDAVINAVVEELLVGNKVNLHALGIFTVKQMPERNCRNPKTGEGMVKPPYKKLTFKPGKAMKTRLT